MSGPGPSIKGSIFALAIQDLLKLVESGQVSRDELERNLEPGDARYLSEPIGVSGWYDVRAYGRVLELLRDLEGNGENEYLRQRGARSAQTLLERGLYQQLEYLDRMQIKAANDPDARFRAFGRDLKLLLSMQLHNFGTRSVEVDPDHPHRYIIEFGDAEAYPEALCWTTDGFINAMAKQHDAVDLWYWERPRPDLVRFKMKRSV